VKSGKGRSGRHVAIGSPIIGAVQGWYVPRYVVEGDAKRNKPARAPDLKTVADLSKYPEVFRDAEEPSKGRFYNCPAGWICEQENTEMLKEYGLENTFVNFRPGTGAALDAAVLSSYKRGEPVLFYYWSPTPLMGQIDAIRLEEKPGVDKNVVTKVGISKAFHEQALNWWRC
jgi:glycine betaine/proline transport system substrate-binding protein